MLSYYVYGYVILIFRSVDILLLPIGQPGLQNVMKATKVYFNPDLSEVIDFRKRFVLSLPNYLYVAVLSLFLFYSVDLLM